MTEEALQHIQENLDNKKASLHLDFCQITGIEKELELLKECTHLETLNLHNNPLQNTMFLKNLRQLKHLNLTKTQTYDITLLDQFAQLQTLVLSENHIRDITVLKNLKQLKIIYLRNNPITDFTVLKDLTQLTGLFLEDTRIQNISFLKHLTKLQKVGIDFKKLQYPTIGMAYLNYKKGKLGDYTHLPELPQIEKVWQLMKSKDEKNIELAHQLALGQGWAEEDFQAYRSLLP